MIDPGFAPLRAALGRCRRHFVAAAGFSLAINLLYVAPTIYMLQVYDRVVPSRGGLTLVFLTGLLLASLAVLALLELTRTRLLVRASMRLDRELAGCLLAAGWKRGRDADSAQTLRDFDVFRQAIAGAGIVALFDVPWTVVYIALCFVLHPVLGVLALCGSGALVGLSLGTERATRTLLDEAANTAARAYGSQARAAAIGEVVTVLGMRPATISRQLNERSGATGRQVEASFTAARFTAGTRFVRLGLQSLGLGAAAWLAVEQQISPGAIFAAALLMSRAFSPLEMVLGSWRSLTEARNAFARLEASLRETPMDTAPTLLPAPTGHLEVEQLWLAGPEADRPLLGGVSFRVRPGEVLGIVGPSGAGKTTLVRTLVGGIKPTRGAVRLDQASLADWDADLLGRHIGYLPQDLGLMQGTVKQNICRFGDASDRPKAEIDAKAIQAAQLCGAHEMILRLPAGYDTMIDWGGGGLSLGQAQRIALARALFDEPSIAVLDEPNAHLDGEGETRLLQTIARLKERGAAVVLVAHRASMLTVMDSLLVLADGRVTHLGARDEVVGQLNDAAAQAQKLPGEREAA
ncbi:MAG TPA: type I secretion system permease/ATPase [Chloroflexota bacterium]